MLISRVEPTTQLPVLEWEELGPWPMAQASKLPSWSCPFLVFLWLSPLAIWNLFGRVYATPPCELINLTPFNLRFVAFVSLPPACSPHSCLIREPADDQDPSRSASSRYMLRRHMLFKDPPGPLLPTSPNFQKRPPSQALILIQYSVSQQKETSKREHKHNPNLIRKLSQDVIKSTPPFLDLQCAPLE